MIGKRLTIEDARREAGKHDGGKCLSTQYINIHTKLLWECKFGHQWWAPLKCVKYKGAWCPICRKLPKKIMRKIQEVLKEKKGKCLSEHYYGAGTKLLWECESGHKWRATPRSISCGNWCPYCSKTAKLTIEEMQKIAESRGGKCLSEVYVDTETKLIWQCDRGHCWKAMPLNIKYNKSWCPVCNNRVKPNTELVSPNKLELRQ
jgi:hypothetical protein